jgi:hypothetical protein
MGKRLPHNALALILLLWSNYSLSQTLQIGTLSSFEAYTGAGAITNSGTFTGDVGTDLGIISGFTSPSFTGTIYNNDAVTAQAKIDLLSLYIDLSNIFVTHPGTHAPAFGDGETITPGVYSIPGAGSLGGTITLNGEGNPDAVFIVHFQGAFTAGAGSTIVLSNETRAVNVFWIAEGAIEIGTNSVIKGTLFSHPGAITLGVNCTIEGRMLASEGAITIALDGVAILPAGMTTIPILCLNDYSPASAVDVLGSVAAFALFTSAGAVSHTGTSGIVGDIGTHFGAISGFGTSTHIGSYYNEDAVTAQAALDLESAYDQLMLLPNTVISHAPAFGSGETLNAGVYSIIGAGSLAGTIILDGQNDPDAIFVFKFGGAFTTAAQSRVILTNGTRSCNVFWIGGAGVPTGAVSMGAFTFMKGTVIAHGDANTIGEGGNLEGRMLSTAGAIGIASDLAVYTRPLSTCCPLPFYWLGLTMDWYDPQNWCGGFVPLSPSTPVLIPLTANQPIIYNLGADIDISGQITLEAMATLTLQAGPALKMSNSSVAKTENGAVIILEPKANYNNSGVGIPTLEVRSLVTGNKGWRMIGSPILTNYLDFLDTFETQGFQGSTNPSLQSNVLWWDETDKGTSLQSWRQPTNLGDAIPIGRGHYFYIFNGAAKPSPAQGNYTDILPLTLSATGQEVNLASGIFDFGVTYTLRDSNLVAQNDALTEVNQADEGFNLIANPTASTLDWNAVSGWTKTNLDESIYVWDPSSSSFLIWNGSFGSLESGLIAPFQGFWMKTNAINPVLQLTGNESKFSVSTDFFGRKLYEKPLSINLQVTGEGMKAESFISFEKDGKLGADTKDAYQLESLAEDWLLLYTYGSLKSKSPLVINNQPALNEEEKVIPLHLAAAKGGNTITGTYLMNWQFPTEWPEAVNVVLMDHINQKAIDMRKESMHTFTFKAPKIETSNARKSLDPLQIPQAVVFESPYESGEVNARVSNSGKPQRPFTIYIGAFPNDRIDYLPDFPKLFAAAPNPFSEQTKIRFYLPVAEKVEINILDLLGNGVGNFPAQDYGAGFQELDWIPNAINLPNGLYIIRLSTSTGQFTQKLIKN